MASEQHSPDQQHIFAPGYIPPPSPNTVSLAPTSNSYGTNSQYIVSPPSAPGPYAPPIAAPTAVYQPYPNQGPSAPAAPVYYQSNENNRGDAKEVYAGEPGGQTLSPPAYDVEKIAPAREGKMVNFCGSMSCLQPSLTPPPNLSKRKEN